MSFGSNLCNSAAKRFRRGLADGNEKRHRRRSQQKLSLERLEPRVVLAAEVVISEFVAENTNGLTDEDDDRTDWIELYNGSPVAQELSGWRLTNDAAQPSGWTIPAGVSLASGEYLVIYASGKDRSADPAALHTDFEIDAAGGYLALVRPDGTTVEHAYDSYPPQLADVSYGIQIVEIVDTSVVTINPTHDLWLRQTDAATVYENDAVWVANSAAVGEDRWGLAEWDLSGISDEILSARMEFSPRTRADADSVQVAFTVSSGIAGETYNSYTSAGGRASSEAPLESLGRVTVPSTGIPFGSYVSSDDASAADLATLNTLRTTTGKLAVALKATTGALEWSDGSNIGGGGFADDIPLRLVIGLGTENEVPTLDLETNFFFTATSPAEINIGGSLNTLVEGVFISEFMAINDNTLDDQDGDASDWIEIYNANTTPVDLSLWQLTDDPTRTLAWSIPAGTTLGAGEFLIVFASGKDRAVAGDELHTNFQLGSSEGEYLALLDGAGVVQHEYMALPQQFTDITYGIQFGELTDPGVAAGDFSLTAAADIWLRESEPDRISEADLISVWSSAGNDGARRYGVVEFDVSALAGEAVSNVTLKLWAGGNGFSDDDKPIKQTAVAIDTSGGTQTTVMNWAAYQAEYAAGSTALQTLGTVDFDPAADGGLNQFVDSPASAVDLAAIQAAANSDNGLLTLVLIADEDGTDYAKSWSDLGYAADPAMLEISVGGEPLRPRRTPLDPTALFYFTTATSLAPNTESGVNGFVEDTKFSADRGFFQQNEAFDLAITSATTGAEIYYTTNGSEPSPTNSESVLFDPGSPIRIDQTSTIRAAAFFAGFAPTNTDTQTYIFLDDVITQSPFGQAPEGWPSGSVSGQVFNYGMDPDIVNDPVWGPQLRAALESLSTISFVTDLDNLVDPQTGLYVNAGGSGRSSERPVSVELINPDGTTGFQIDAGMRPRGNFSASGSNPKHAFRLFFRDEYGEKALEYPLFGDEGVKRFRKLDLRTSQNDSWAFQGSEQLTFIHDVFARDLQREMGQPYTRSRYAHLYINGVYWGLYQTQERSERNYGQSYLGGDDNDYDVIKATGGGGGYQTEVTDGNPDAWFDLWTQARTIAVDPSQANYMRIQGLNPDGTRNTEYPVLLDVDNLIDYMLGIFYTGDEDRGLSLPLQNNRPNNFFAMRNREADRGFAFFAQDAEQSMLSFHNRGGLNANRVGPFTGSNQNNFTYSNPQWIHQDLAANESYRREFADRVHKYFFNDGLLTPDAVAGAFGSRADEIDLAIIAESARWGDAQVSTPLDKNTWLNALDRMATEFFPLRTEIVLQQLRQVGLYPDLSAPVFNQHGGEILPGFSVSMSDPGSILFNDTVIVAAGASARTIVPNDASLGQAWTQLGFGNFAGWTNGSTGTGIGYEDTPSDYDALINTDIGITAGSQPTSLYTRINFDLTTDVAAEDLIVLKMRFDDGFVAYLDGVEIARSNAPGAVDVPPAFDATAVGPHDEPVSLPAQAFDVTDTINSRLGGLSAGSHVLAIQGLNVFANSSDMLILPELVIRDVNFTGGGSDIYFTTDGSDPRGDDGLPSPTATLFTSAEILNTSSEVNARILVDGQWSALNSALFTVDVPLRITEIMYHPADPTQGEQTAGFLDGDDFEFLELTNTGSLALDLDGVSLTDGVEFTFGPTLLSAGESLVIVRDLGAFAARYGSGLERVAGEYGNDSEDAGLRKLSNGGEDIRLEDPAGGLIQEFRYDDKTSEGWYDETDGDGFSLVLADLNNESDLAANWRVSAAVGGSPTVADPEPVLGDFNHDGKANRRDAVILLRNFGPVGNTNLSRGDANGDGRTTLIDAALLQSNFGAAPVASPQAPAASITAVLSGVAPDRGAVDAVFEGLIRSSRRVRSASVARGRSRLSQTFGEESRQTTTETATIATRSHRSATRSLRLRHHPTVDLFEWLD